MRAGKGGCPLLGPHVALMRDRGGRSFRPRLRHRVRVGPVRNRPGRVSRRGAPQLVGRTPAGWHPDPVLLALLAVVLLAVLGFAVLRPKGLPEATAAVPAALLVIGLGAISWSEAGEEVRSLGPTVGFLAAVLLLGYLCEVEGVFAWAGALCAKAGRGDPQRLLVLVFGLASVTTAVLSLDATVVLLTPVVFTTAARQQLPDDSGCNFQVG